MTTTTRLFWAMADATAIVEADSDPVHAVREFSASKAVGLTTVRLIVFRGNRAETTGTADAIGSDARARKMKKSFFTEVGNWP